jgi:hypothetical protein
VRTVFAFPACGRAETVAALDRQLPDQRHPWVLNGVLYIEIEDESAGMLYADWEPEDLAALEAAIGPRPNWAVQIDISGRTDGTVDVHRILEILLDRGGVAFDDYTSHAWTLQEISSGVTVGGLRFFDFHTHHETHSEYR